MISYQNKHSNCYLLVARVKRRGIVHFLSSKWYCGGVCVSLPQHPGTGWLLAAANSVLITYTLPDWDGVSENWSTNGTLFIGDLYPPMVFTQRSSGAHWNEPLGLLLGWSLTAHLRLCIPLPARMSTLALVRVMKRAAELTLGRAPVNP